MSAERTLRGRIAISGSAGTGKTTLATRLADRLGVPYAEEGMRRRLEAGLDLHHLSREAHRDLTEALFDELIDSAAAAERSHGGCVCDRCPTDFVAFWLYYGFGHLDDAATARFVGRAREALAHFTAVVVLPWGAIPLAADGVRSPRPWVQLHFQALLEGLLRHHLRPPRLLRMPAGVTGLEARERWTVARLEKIGAAQ